MMLCVVLDGEVVYRRGEGESEQVDDAVGDGAVAGTGGRFEGLLPNRFFPARRRRLQPRRQTDHGVQQDVDERQQPRVDVQARDPILHGFSDFKR